MSYINFLGIKLGFLSAFIKDTEEEGANGCTKEWPELYDSLTITFGLPLKFDLFVLPPFSTSKRKTGGKKIPPRSRGGNIREREDLVPFSQFCFKLCLLFLHLLLSQTSAGLRKLIVDYRDSILQKGNGLLPI